MRQVPESERLSRERALQVDFSVHSPVHWKSLLLRSHCALQFRPQRFQCGARSSQEPPKRATGAPRRAQQEELPHTLNLTRGLEILCVPRLFAYSEKLRYESRLAGVLHTLNLTSCLPTNWKSCLIPCFSPQASKSFAYPLSFCIFCKTQV